MRVNNKGGVPPRDRRLDRRKVAIAAVAALFLFAATPAKAATVFNIIPGLSSMTIAQDIDLTPLALGVVSVIPQGPGSLTSGLFGNIVAAGIESGFMSFPGGSDIGYTFTGAYLPNDPVTSDPPFPPVGPPIPGNYGIAEPTILGLAQVQYNMRADLLGAPSALSAGTSGTWAFTPGVDALIGTDGRLVFTSVLGSDSGDMIGDPFAALGTAGVTPGTWDPLDPTAGPMGTLTIPIESSFTTALTDDALPPGGITITFFQSGVIIATPAPEPSSLVLLGVGVVGLLACGWRLRKKKV